MATINGAHGPDSLTGTSSADHMSGKDGADTVHAGGGDDTVFGNAGNDSLYGESGADFLGGGDGNDRIDGGGGNDTASYGEADAGVHVDLSLSTAQDTGGAGSDTLVSIETLSGSAFGDTLSAAAGANLLRGNDGNDHLLGGADDTLRGGAGSDTAGFLGATGGVRVNVTVAGFQDTHGAGTMVLTGIENLDGTTFDDTLIGGAGANHLDGRDGNDILAGAGGADVLTGGAGDDNLVEYISGGGTMDGGTGDDFITLFTGCTADGGQNTDHLEYFNSASAVTVDVDLRSATTIDLGANTFAKGFETYLIDFGSGADKVHAGNHGDSLYGGGGDDKLTGGKGDDTLAGFTGDDNVSGGDGDDCLTGFDGVDTLSGGDGADTIFGGLEQDQMSGGAGADRFVFTLAPDSARNTVFSDVISDLSDAEDVIDLGGIDANANKVGDQAFKLVAAFDGHAGEARLALVGGDTQLMLDTNGDSQPDSVIVLTGDHTGFTGFVL